MTKSLRSEEGPAKRAIAKPTNHAKRRIVFVASRQAVYECLFQAAERYFSTFELSYLDNIPSTPLSDVSLVLLSDGQERTERDYFVECRSHFPGASIGLMVESRAEAVDNLLIEERLVQGVIPLSLPLDVWLAVVSLLASGGEYSPSGVARATNQSASTPPPETKLQAGLVPHEYQEAGRDDGLAQPVAARNNQGDETVDIQTLTMREREILQLVSEGLQNKIIADRMALSENTVKAHVHNLIAKLRVSNRTQAAAFLHDRQIARGGRGGGRSPAGSAPLPGR